MVEALQVKKTLLAVDRIRKQELKLQKAKGEQFNIFSILKMESKENATHSAFLGELLNPKGSHLMGAAFLELFLKEVSPEKSDKKMDSTSSRLILEKYIGKRNDETKEGGRIDIYLEDARGYSVSIENKIYANDQYAQIERYVKHNKAKNTVYYLTLRGEEPSEDSKGEIQSGEAFHCISYGKTIVSWLEKCHQLAANQPILRESIRQYILLIKKLCHQLNNKAMKEDIQEIIAQNYEAAKLLQGNVSKAELEYARIYLEEIKKEVLNTLGTEWEVSIDDDLSKTYTGLKVKHSSWKSRFIALEGQSTVAWGQQALGLRAWTKNWNRSEILNVLSNTSVFEGFSNSTYWPYYKRLPGFNSDSERKKLFNITEREIMVTDIAERLIELCKACKEPLAGIKKIGDK